MPTMPSVRSPGHVQKKGMVFACHFGADESNATKFVGKVVAVGWPYLVPGKVVSIVSGPSAAGVIQHFSDVYHVECGESKLAVAVNILELGPSGIAQWAQKTVDFPLQTVLPLAACPWILDHFF
jgi:hypothetical protein